MCRSQIIVKMFGATSGKAHHISMVDSLKTYTIIAFLEKIQKICHKLAIVLDNASYHKSNEVNKFIESTRGDTVPVFLQSYTPQLSPVEMQWRELKRLLAGQLFKSLNALKDTAGIISDTVKLVSYMTYRYNPPLAA